MDSEAPHFIGLNHSFPTEKRGSNYVRSPMRLTKYQDCLKCRPWVLRFSWPTSMISHSVLPPQKPGCLLMPVSVSRRSRLAVTTASYIPGTHYHAVQDYNSVVVVPDSPHSTSDNRTKGENGSYLIRSSANLYKNSFPRTIGDWNSINQDQELPHRTGV